MESQLKSTEKFLNNLFECCLKVFLHCGKNGVLVLFGKIVEMHLN